MSKESHQEPGKSSHELLEKVEHLIEEPAPSSSEKVEEKKPPKVRQRALITYIALLFGVAFVLVLLSFLAQQRDISKMNQNTNNALSRAEQLQDDNRELRENNTALQNQLTDVLSQLETQRQTAESLQTQLDEALQKVAGLEVSLGTQEEDAGTYVQAYELLLTAQRALDEERTEEFQKAMTSLAPLADNLDKEGKALYQELLTATAMQP